MAVDGLAVGWKVGFIVGFIVGFFAVANIKMMWLVKSRYNVPSEKVRGLKLTGVAGKHNAGSELSLASLHSLSELQQLVILESMSPVPFGGNDPAS